MTSHRGTGELATDGKGSGANGTLACETPRMPWPAASSNQKPPPIEWSGAKRRSATKYARGVPGAEPLQGPLPRTATVWSPR